MTRPDLDAIRARCDAASGPTWTWEINDATTPVRSDVSRIVSMDAMRDRQQSGIKTSARLPYLATVYNRADTEFIAHARTDIPALLAYVADLEERCRAYESMRSDIARALDTWKQEEVNDEA